MPTNGSTALILPLGFRPLEVRHFAQYAQAASSFTHGLLRVSPNGFCALFFPGTSISFFATELSFVAEQ
jgi:hypothetical protein